MQRFLFLDRRHFDVVFAVRAINPSPPLNAICDFKVTTHVSSAHHCALIQAARLMSLLRAYPEILSSTKHPSQLLPKQSFNRANSLLVGQTTQSSNTNYSIPTRRNPHRVSVAVYSVRRRQQIFRSYENLKRLLPRKRCFPFHGRNNIATIILPSSMARSRKPLGSSQETVRR